MQNYHKHTSYSNILVADCAASYEDYVKRALELGHKVISSVEHGYQSNYYVPYELVQKNNENLKKQLETGSISKEEYEKRLLKFVFGAEAYWVKDRQKEYEVQDKKGEIKFQKDRTNCHIVLLAKNEEGRRDINEALSEASISGFYGQPRMDIELLLKIKPENVIITTACLKFWVYEDIDEILLKLFSHFKNNLYLEIQYHNTDIQKKINKHIIELSEKHGIDIIFGYDSHYIFPDDSVERDNYLEGRGITYDDDERGWYMDYPDETEVRRRLEEQGILTPQQIDRCIKNTDIILDFDDLFFDKDIKLPSIHKELTLEQKNDLLTKLVYEKWYEVRKNVPEERHKEYIQGIEYELSAIRDTGMADYFLDDYEIVEEGKKNGGIVTKTGRGSGVSYYVNSLLGFSDIDRFISPVKLYPDRFMSKTRILLTRSLPDLDLNLGNPEVFAAAQEKILGEGHSYPMISYKPLQKSSAFKLYAKAQKLDFSIANDITMQIKQYEKDLKHADTPEDKEAINLYDYVDKKYHNYLDEAKKYQGIINTKSQAPCGYLIYDGDIKREIGLIRCKSEATGKEVITTVIDGMVAENYKFVKNDLLKVDIWLTINKIFEKIGIPTYTVKEMTDAVNGDKATWDIYANGYTLGVNQCESDFGRQCCKQYKPENMQELTALVAALRPGFKTQLNTFLNRKPYTTGVDELDNLLKDSFHYMMYQENIMTYLGWLGIDQTETYAIIKKISKKKFKEKELAELKQQLIQGWIKNVGTEEGFEKTWEIIEAASKYSFNASHAYSYAYDSVYGAYLKAHYPYEFYATMLQFLSEKGDKDKVTLYKKEMNVGFGIKEGKYKIGLDNRAFTIDKENNSINPSLLSLKGFSQTSANDLYVAGTQKFNSYIDLRYYIKNHTTVKKSLINDLIKIGYFTDFGTENKILRLEELFITLYDKKEIKKEKLDEIGLLHEDVIQFCKKETDKKYMQVDIYRLLKYLEIIIKNIRTPVLDKIKWQHEIMGYINIQDKLYKGLAYVTEIDTKYSPKVKVYALANGKTLDAKIDRKTFNCHKINVGDIIRIDSNTYKPQLIKDEETGKFTEIPNTKVLWITKYSKVVI